MKKNELGKVLGGSLPRRNGPSFKKVFFLLTSFIVLLSFGQARAQDNITMNMQNADLVKIFKEIEKQGKYRFVYKDEIIPKNKKVNINVTNASLEQVMQQALASTTLSFRKMNDNLVVISLAGETGARAAGPLGAKIGGKVTTDKGEPLMGATVQEKGTNNTVVTDGDGNFTITPQGSKPVLTVSYIGYDERDITVNSAGLLAIQLNTAVQASDSVVIVGYGRQKKQSVVGSIAQVGGDVLQRTGGVSNIGAALTGNLPGLVTVASTGVPGADDPQILIRGQSTWNGSSPLILVDGVERPMSGVDINAVESISILKDASATAVFGVKGANGVILITTKRGQAGKANISITSNNTLKVPSRLPQKYDSYDALRIRNLAIEREVSLFPASWADYTPYSELNKYRNPANLAEAERYPNIDWIDETVKKSAMTNNANLNLSGGTSFVKYFTAFDFLQEGDVMKARENGKGYRSGYGYKRFNVRVNLDFKLTNTTTLTANLANNHGIRKSTYNGFEYRMWQSAYAMAPDVMYPQYSDGTWGYYPNDPITNINSAQALSNGGEQRSKTTQLTTDFALNQDLGMLLKGLSFRGTLSMDNSFGSTGGIYDEEGWTVGKWIAPDGTVIYRDPRGLNQFDFVVPPWSVRADAMGNGSTRRRNFYQAQLNYAQRFGKHNVTAMGLFIRDRNANGSEFPRFREDWVFRSTYNFDSRYFLEFNGAYNGTEKFSPDFRFDFFPSAAVGWTVTNEKFMQNVKFVNNLKFRGSYGLVGDDNGSPRFQYSTQWASGGNSPIGTFGGNSPYSWFRESLIGNPNIQWETVTKLNLAVDFSLFDKLIEGSFDVFRDHRTNILIGGTSRAVPVYFGGTPPSSNLGEVKTRGYEGEIKVNKRVGKNLRLWANINFTHAKDRIIDADDPQLLDSYQKRAGFQIGQYMSQISTGYYNTWDQVYGSPIVNANDAQKLPGNFNLLDFNGDGRIDDYDRVPYGYPERPQNTYSTTVGFEYKGLGMFVQFYGVNNVTRNFDRRNFPANMNAVWDQGDFWTKENTNAASPVPRWKSQLYSYGDFYQFDASYLRLKNAEVSYTFQRNLLKKVGVQSLRIFLNGNNLVLWSDMPDDRESNFAGLASQGAYPTLRRYNLGLNVVL